MKSEKNIDKRVNRKIANQAAIDFWEKLKSQQDEKFWITEEYKTITKNREALKVFLSMIDKIKNKP